MKEKAVGNNVGQNVQDPFLNTLRREKVPVTIFLVNGVKLQGVISSYDNYCLLLKNGVTQLVFKHAVSTVMPSRNITINARPEPEVAAEE